MVERSPKLKHTSTTVRGQKELSARSVPGGCSTPEAVRPPALPLPTEKRKSRAGGSVRRAQGEPRYCSRTTDVVGGCGPRLATMASVSPSRRRNLAVRAEVAPLHGITTCLPSGDEDMAIQPERPASNQRDTVTDAELIVSVIDGDIDRVHRLVLAALGLAAVFVTQIPLSQLRALPEFFQVLTVIAIALLASAAVLLFAYTQRLNLRRLQIAQVALIDPPRNMHEAWGANFENPGSRWDRLREDARDLGRAVRKLGHRQGHAASKLDDQQDTSEQQTPEEKARATARWVRPLTYGNLLLGAGGLVLAVVVARLLLG